MYGHLRVDEVGHEMELLEMGVCQQLDDPLACLTTTFQSIMNAKLSQQRFWPCHENRLIKTISIMPGCPKISETLKLASLYIGLG